MVLRQPQNRLLQVRRKAGTGLPPPGRSDPDSEQGRRRGVSEGGRAESIVDLFVHDVASKKSAKVDVRNGRPFDNDVVATTSTASRGRRIDRAAVQPDQSKAEHPRIHGGESRDRATRTIVREEWPTGWIENSPSMTFSKTAVASSGNRSGTAGGTLSLRSERQADRAADLALRASRSDRS